MSETLAVQSVQKVIDVSDKYVLQLEKIEAELAGAIKQLYTASSQTDLIDTILLRNNIASILSNTGYYEVVDAYYSEGFQEFVDASYEFYKDAYGMSLSFTEESLQKLTAIKQASENRLLSLSDSLKSDIEQQIIRMQFGGVTGTDALSILSDQISSYMKRYIYTWINTTSIDISTSINQFIAEDAGITKYRYTGVMDKLNRQFCRNHLNEIHTIEEWQNMQNDQGGSVWTDRGGWNCRHTFVGVPDGE